LCGDEADGMNRTKFILLVPTRFNDGRPITKKELSHIQNELFLLAGGYTIAGKVRGAYRMRDGSRQADESWCFWIVLPQEDEPHLKKLVADIGARLGQEAMYLERVEGAVEFVQPSDAEHAEDENEDR
jgi:hypothetical protein